LLTTKLHLASNATFTSRRLVARTAASLDVAKQRLGPRANQVEWIVGDVARYPFAADSIDLWHDRAVLHFLVDSIEASAYVNNATRTIRKGGYAVIGGFASDGPEKCSGLTVARREPEDIAQLFGTAFTLVEQRHETHVTPWGSSQKFSYALLRKCRRISSCSRLAP
jgi:ubiquinone/menaquinone biosynthesis C-methylase UbiE